MPSTKVTVRAQYSPNGMQGNPSYGPYLKWPNICPCCGQHLYKGVKRTLSFSQQVGRTLYSFSWDIRYCELCDKHNRTYSRFVLISILAFLFWIIVGGFILSQLPSIEKITIPAYIAGVFGIPVISMAVYWLFIKKQMGINCTNMREAVAYKSFDGVVHNILFKNRTYAERFAEANGGDLAETPVGEAPFF